MSKRPFRNLFRKLAESDRFMSALCRVISWVLKLVYMSGSFELVNREHIDPIWQNRTPAIMCIWHGRTMLITFGWQADYNTHALVSPHRDGRLLAFTLKHLGMEVVAGSSNRNPKKAALQIMRLLKDGQTVTITSDGPRGPRMRIKKSMIEFAARTGVPIVPAAFSASKCKILKSWDRFMLVKPFSKGVYIFGEPITIEADADEKTIEIYRKKLENRMNALTVQADTMMGIDPVQPADENEQPKKKRKDRE